MFATVAVMSLLPASPRKRRRLGWAALGLVAVAAGGATIAALPKGEPVAVTPPSAAAAAAASAAPAPLPDGKETRLTPAVRREIDRTLEEWIPAALERRDPARAWELSGPGLRGGTPHGEWVKGNLPVSPFEPKLRARYEWRPGFVYENRVGFDLLLQPRSEYVGAIAYAIDMVRQGDRWVVDLIYPKAIFEPAKGKHNWVTGPPDFAAGGFGTNYLEQDQTFDSRMDVKWLLVPAGLLGVGVLGIPLAALALSVRRRRQTARAYAEWDARRAADA
jgi:hypothetical protein